MTGQRWGSGSSETTSVLGSDSVQSYSLDGEVRILHFRDRLIIHHIGPRRADLDLLVEPFDSPIWSFGLANATRSFSGVSRLNPGLKYLNLPGSMVHPEPRVDLFTGDLHYFYFLLSTLLSPDRARPVLSSSWCLVLLRGAAARSPRCFVLLRGAAARFALFSPTSDSGEIVVDAPAVLLNDQKSDDDDES